MYTQELEKRALAMAQNRGYNTIRHDNDWNGFVVFSAFVICEVYGRPAMIFADGENLRWATEDEMDEVIFSL